MILNIRSIDSGNNIINIWKRNFILFIENPLLSLTWISAEPIFILLAMGYGLGFLIDKVEGVSYVRFITPAIFLSATMHVCVNETGIVFFDKFVKGRLLKYILLTPISSFELVFGEILWAVTKGMFLFFVLALVATILKLMTLKILLISALVVLLNCFLFSSMGMVISSLAKSKNSFIYLHLLIILPMYFLSGVFFPIETLPQSIEILSYFLPLTHSIMALRSIYLGNIDSSLFLHLSVVIVYIFIFSNYAATKMSQKLTNS